MVDWNKKLMLSARNAPKKSEPAEAPLPGTPPGPAAAPAPKAPAEVPAAAESSPLPTPTPAAPVAVSPAPPAPPAPAQATPAPLQQPEAEAVEPEGERAPWYKRDISFGGGEKAAKPKAKQEKAKKEKPPKGERVPFYKRELSFGGKKDKPKRDKAKKEKPPKGERVPFYKRDLSFGGKKEAKAPTGKSKQAAASAKRMKRITGLKIGGSQLAAARVNNNGVPELVQIARQDLEPGIVVGGELRDLEALSAALKDFFKRHKLPRQGVRLGIANNRIGVRIFEIAGIEDVKQLENAVRFRAHEVLPIPIEEAVIDWQVLDEREEDDGSVTRRILLVVAYRDLLDRYVVACEKAGIKLVGIDLEAFALLRAISEPLPAEAGTANAAVVVVAVGHDRSTFAVSNGRVCEFTRVLDWGGATLNVAIARELDIAPSEAEPIKRALSLTHADVVEGLTEEQGNRAREAVRRQRQR